MTPLHGSRVPSQFSGETDEDLILFMALREDDPALAQEAWAEFYTRHVEYLFGVCQSSYGRLLGQDAICEVVQQAFIKAYERAETFKSTGLKGDEARWYVRGWLGTIAKNILRDSFRGTPTLALVTDERNDAITDEVQCEGKWWEAPFADGGSSPRLTLLCEALETLSDREQDILRVTALWYRPGQQAQRVPPEDMQELCRVLQTTPENVRQIRKRAMSKIRAYIEAHEGRN